MKNNSAVSHNNFACIILTAGQSSRMMRSKIVLPWGKGTVIGKIISSFRESGVEEIIVVTGGYRDLVEAEVAKYGVKTVFNPDFANGSMILSLQFGLNQLVTKPQAIFVALGDQPDIDSSDLQGMIKKSIEFPENIIVPSYSMRRGHPWLVPEKYFDELLAIHKPDTMKIFLQNHESEIEYYLVKKSNILADLDTLEDYERLKPQK
jgi:molybdenum cofactor cytidylyltransferase